MRLSPIDMLNQRFPRSMRGYRCAAVDDFLRESAADYEAVVAENTELRQTIEGLRREVEGYHVLEGTLKEALVLAQKTADETRASAHREADSTLNEARRRAAILCEETERSLVEVRSQRQRFAREFRSMLQSFLAELDQAAAEPSASATDPEHDGAR